LPFVDSCDKYDLDGRWPYLGLEVEDDGETSPRQIIGTVPYVRSLQPGARIVGDVPGESVRYIENTGVVNHPFFQLDERPDCHYRWDQCRPVPPRPQY
jgi:hypothetical protein